MDAAHQFARKLRRNMTDAEQLLWMQLRSRRFAGHKFRRQHPIGRYVVDFVSLADALIIEADGGQHNGSESDSQRDAWLTAQGFRLMRFWNHDILTNTQAVLQAIWNELDAPSPSIPLPEGEGSRTKTEQGGAGRGKRNQDRTGRRREREAKPRQNRAAQGEGSRTKAE